ELEVKKKKQMISLERSNALSKEDRKKYKWVLRFLQEAKRQVYTAAVTDGKEAFALMKVKFDETVAEMKEDTSKTGKELHNLFVFVEQAFEEGNEMLILVGNYGKYTGETTTLELPGKPVQIKDIFTGKPLKGTAKAGKHFLTVNVEKDSYRFLYIKF
ncbi:MAG: hypothetical protein J6S58_09650, partial [Lentisphaeria bacterium]|nr:hypothetical protein [Lentisphaeria bacterium]